jgi:hypothetical protein
MTAPVFEFVEFLVFVVFVVFKFLNPLIHNP